MGRNGFEVSHNCFSNNGEEVFFTVLIGNQPICPKCNKVVVVPPSSEIRTAGNNNVFSNPQYAEAMEAL